MMKATEQSGVKIAEARTHTREAVIRQPFAAMEHPCVIALAVSCLA